jgi:hypothetical protein
MLSVGGDVPVDSEVLLVTDFVNLKIKPAQSFRSVLRVRVCVRVFIGVSARTCMSICVCTVFLKKIKKIDSLHRACAVRVLVLLDLRFGFWFVRVPLSSVVVFLFNFILPLSIFLLQSPHPEAMAQG